MPFSPKKSTVNLRHNLYLRKKKLIELRCMECAVFFFSPFHSLIARPFNHMHKNPVFVLHFRLKAFSNRNSVHICMLVTFSLWCMNPVAFPMEISPIQYSTIIVEFWRNCSVKMAPFDQNLLNLMESQILTRLLGTLHFGLLIKTGPTLDFCKL